MNNDPPLSRSERWVARLRRLRTLGKSLWLFAAGLLTAFVALQLYSVLFPPPPPLTKLDVKTAIAQAMASATPPPAYSVGVYQVIRPSLILIQTKVQDTDGKKGSGLGSGIIVNDNGDILTSLHVISDADEIQVTFADGTQSSAQVVAKQPENDIAVIHASQSPALIIPATLGNPNAMRIGDEAYVVGNPFGLYSTLTAGVISGFNRSFQPAGSDITLHHLIQIDAAVNPGNSGGPLLNRYGQVIGIVEGIVNPTGQDVYIGIGFAVPIDVAGGAAGLPPD